MASLKTNNWLNYVVCRVYRRGTLVLAAFSLSLGFLGFILPKALATRLPPELTAAVTKEFPRAKIRLDGAFDNGAGELYLPLVPIGVSAGNTTDFSLKGLFPTKSEPNLLAFGNGWFYAKVHKHGQVRTLSLPADLPEPIKKALLRSRFVPDLIVPENFALPRSFKPLAGELTIAVFDDIRSLNPGTKSVVHLETNKQPEANRSISHWGIFVTSPRAGKITLLDENSYAKLAEFPTEGTPGGLAFANGRLYIADQSKNRILKIDPIRRQFVGQIDLPEHSAPKGLAALANGKLFYASESGTASVAVFEVESGRLLLRTKVLPGPTRMAITPNGTVLIVLNSSVGKVTMISTQNQRVLSTVAVGSLPNAIVISDDSVYAYVSNRASSTVSVIDIAKHQVVETLQTGAGPTGLALANRDKLFVANARDNTISVFDLQNHKKIEDIRLPLDLDFPGGLSFLPNKHEILVSSASTDAIGLLDANTFTFEKQPIIGHPSNEFLRVPL